MTESALRWMPSWQWHPRSSTTYTLVSIKLHDTARENARSDSLLLSEEVQTGLAVEVMTTRGNRVLVAGERERRNWDRDRDVDADLTSLDVALEARGGGTAVGEDSYTITVFVGVDEINCVFERVDFH